MGSSLVPVLANVILKRISKKCCNPLIKSEIIKFCFRCVDDTLEQGKARSDWQGYKSFYFILQ